MAKIDNWSGQRLHKLQKANSEYEHDCKQWTRTEGQTKQRRTKQLKVGEIWIQASAALWTTEVWRCKWLFFLKLDGHKLQRNGRSLVCFIRMCSFNPLRKGNDASHWTQEKFRSFRWILRTCLFKFPLCKSIYSTGQNHRQRRRQNV